MVKYPTERKATETNSAQHTLAPSVGELIAKARPVIAGMSGRSVLTVLGGKGLPTT